MAEGKEDGDKGLIFNIQRFSVHDGPGIRTTIFMQGCPLRCRWCSNPESWTRYPVIMTRDAKCICCGKCVDACPEGAINLDEKKGRCIDFSKCNQCGACAEVCPSQAIKMSGSYMTVQETVDIAKRDGLFYQNSGGGVTISGGEPTMQATFVESLMKKLKETGLHVALDTCGQAAWEDLERLVEYADLVLFDIKHMDSKRHFWGTGKGNELILSNCVKAGRKAKVWLRIPLIAGYNDSEENIYRVVELGDKIGAEKISLLPYHKWGEAKYEQIGLKYVSQEGNAPDPERMKRIEDIITGMGLEVAVGN